MVTALLGRLAARRKASRRAVDPVGWGDSERRVHDVTILPGGHVTLHHSTCWCRSTRRVSAVMSPAEVRRLHPFPEDDA